MGFLNKSISNDREDYLISRIEKLKNENKNLKQNIIVETDNITFRFLKEDIKFKKEKNYILFKKKGEISKDDIKAYLLYVDGSYNLEFYPIESYSIQYQREKERQSYNFLDKALFTYKGKPVFYVFNDSLITVDSIETKNSKYVMLFSPENWYNIINNVITSKLTRGSDNVGILGAIGKYWKILIVILICIVGFLSSQGVIKFNG